MTSRQSVTGIGGVFFKARDPHALAEWYREHLGIPVPSGITYVAFKADATASDSG